MGEYEEEFGFGEGSLEEDMLEQDWDDEDAVEPDEGEEEDQRD
jgi:hypothetical protein